MGVFRGSTYVILGVILAAQANALDLTDCFGCTREGFLNIGGCSGTSFNECFCADQDYLNSTICCFADACIESSRDALNLLVSECARVGTHLGSNIGCAGQVRHTVTSTLILVPGIQSSSSVATIQVSSITLIPASSRTSQLPTSSTILQPFERNSHPGSNTSLRLGVGVGVGLPLGSILIGALAYLLYRRQRNKRVKSTEPETIVECGPVTGAEQGKDSSSIFNNNTSTKESGMAGSVENKNRLSELPGSPGLQVAEFHGEGVRPYLRELAASPGFHVAELP